MMMEHDLFVNGLPLAVSLLNLLVIFGAGVLASAAGVGGGAVYTPLYILLFGLLYEAVPLSKAAVCGASMAFLTLTFLKPTPGHHRYKFAYDVIMVMEPATLLGTVFGVIVSRGCPYWLISTIMTSLLSFSTYKTFRKAKSLAKEEVEDSNSDNIELLMIVRSSEQDSNTILLENNPFIGVRCFVGVGFCFVFVLITASLEHRIRHTHCRSLVYWTLILSNVIVCGAVTYWNARYLVNHSLVLKSHFALKWDSQAALRYSLLCLVAGFLSALCGIGGSTIKGPLLLEMGLHPILAKSTSQLMLVSTVSSSAIQFYISGFIPPQYGLVFFMLGICSGVVGHYLVERMVRRPSTLVFLLGCYIAFATVSMTIIGIMNASNVKSYGFMNICSMNSNSTQTADASILG